MADRDGRGLTTGTPAEDSVFVHWDASPSTADAEKATLAELRTALGVGGSGDQAPSLVSLSGTTTLTLASRAHLNAIVMAQNGSVLTAPNAAPDGSSWLVYCAGATATVAGQALTSGKFASVIVTATGSPPTVSVQVEGTGDAVSLRGIALDSTVGSPSNGDILVYRSAGTDWVLEAKPAAGANPATSDVQFAATDRLLGRDTASGGAGEEITVSGGLEFTGSGGVRRSALTGDATATAGSSATSVVALRGIALDSTVGSPSDGNILVYRSAGTDWVLEAKPAAGSNPATSDVQFAATDRILGRDTAGAGGGEELTVSGGLEFTGTGIQRSALTGNVTAPAGSNATTIAAAVVANSMLANMAQNTIKGRVTASTGVPEDLTAAQAKSVLAIAVADVSGAAPTASPTFTGTVTLPNGTVAAAKTTFSATDRLLGRDTAAAGNGEELTVGGGLEFTGSGGIQRSALTGNVTAAAGSGATTIAAGVVANSMLADMAQATFKMRAAAAGTGAPIDGTAAQAKTALAIAVADVSGAAPTATPTFTGLTTVAGVKVASGTATGTLTEAAHGGGVFTTSGNCTCPNAAGFSVTLIAGGAHTVNVGTGAATSLATGDVLSVFIPAVGTVRAVKTLAADVITMPVS